MPAPTKWKSEERGNEVEQRLLTSSLMRVQLMRLAMKGLSATEASRILGIRPETAMKHYRSREFRDAVLRKVEGAFADIDRSFVDKQKTLHEKLEEQAARSFDDLVRMLEDKTLSPSHRIKINQDFLNRSEQTQPMARVTTGGVDAEALRRAAVAAQEMEAGVIEIKKAANG